MAIETLTLFIHHHAWLCGLWALTGISLAGIYLYGEWNQAPSISPEVAVHWINHQKAVLLDLRPTPEFIKNHIPQSEHIELDWAHIAESAKSTPVILICGNESSIQKPLKLLSKNRELRPIVLLKGGISAWERANLLLVSGEKRRARAKS